MSVSCLRPQTPGATRPRRLASSHKLGRPVGLASPLRASDLLPNADVGDAA